MEGKGRQGEGKTANMRRRFSNGSERDLSPESHWDFFMANLLTEAPARPPCLALPLLYSDEEVEEDDVASAGPLSAAEARERARWRRPPRSRTSAPSGKGRGESASPSRGLRPRPTYRMNEEQRRLRGRDRSSSRRRGWGQGRTRSLLLFPSLLDVCCPRASADFGGSLWRRCRWCRPRRRPGGRLALLSSLSVRIRERRRRRKRRDCVGLPVFVAAAHGRQVFPRWAFWCGTRRPRARATFLS